jgi:hypothetical protein
MNEHIRVAERTFVGVRTFLYRQNESVCNTPPSISISLPFSINTTPCFFYIYTYGIFAVNCVAAAFGSAVLTLYLLCLMPSEDGLFPFDLRSCSNDTRRATRARRKGWTGSGALRHKRSAAVAKLAHVRRTTTHERRRGIAPASSA